MSKFKNVILSGLFIAIGIILPFITMNIPAIGQALLPIHIPVLLCGIICGKKYGFFVGAILPSLRFLLFGMPPLFPIGLAMTFELATYGFVIGFVYEKLPKKNAFIYISLFIAMIFGRIAFGIAMAVLTLNSPMTYSIEIFIQGAIVTAIPGIILQIILIPTIVIALKNAGYIKDSKKQIA